MPPRPTHRWRWRPTAARWSACSPRIASSSSPPSAASPSASRTRSRSFDGIWADFNIEPFFGFETWEATAFVRLGIEPDTRAHLLLPQAPILNVLQGLDPERMQIELSSNVSVLRDHLLNFHSAEHEVHFVTTGMWSGPHLLASGIETVALRDLDHPGAQPSARCLCRARSARASTSIARGRSPRRQNELLS